MFRGFVTQQQPPFRNRLHHRCAGIIGPSLIKENFLLKFVFFTLRDQHTCTDHTARTVLVAIAAIAAGCGHCTRF